jgi:hypothetical protein
MGTFARALLADLFWGVLAADIELYERKLLWLAINLRALGPTFGQVGSASRC